MPSLQSIAKTIRNCGLALMVLGLLVIFLPRYAGSRKAREVAIEAMQLWEEALRPALPWFELEFVEADPTAAVQVEWKRASRAPGPDSVACSTARSTAASWWAGAWRSLPPRTRARP